MEQRASSRPDRLAAGHLSRPGAVEPVNVTWPAATDADGIARYELQQSINGAAWTAISRSPVTARAKVVQVAGTSASRFRVRAFDPAGNASVWAEGVSLSLSRIEEKAKAVVFTGSWTRVALSGASGGYVRHAKTATAKASHTFTGRGSPWS